MKKNIFQQGFAPVAILIAVLFIGVLVGGGVYLNTQRTNPSQPNSSPSPAKEKTTTEAKPSMKAGGMIDINSTFLGLVGQSQSLECDWTPPDMTDIQVAKVWISGGKVRSHIEAKEAIGNMVMVADAVFQNNTVISWVEVPGAGKIGFKMTKDDIEKATQGLTAEEKKQAEEYSKENKYSCKPWTVDASKFEVPSDVKFYN